MLIACCKQIKTKIEFEKILFFRSRFFLFIQWNVKGMCSSYVFTSWINVKHFFELKMKHENMKSIQKDFVDLFSLNIIYSYEFINIYTHRNFISVSIFRSLNIFLFLICFIDFALNEVNCSDIPTVKRATER